MYGVRDLYIAVSAIIISGGYCICRLLLFLFTNRVIVMHVCVMCCLSATHLSISHTTVGGTYTKQNAIHVLKRSEYIRSIKCSCVYYYYYYYSYSYDSCVNL